MRLSRVFGGGLAGIALAASIAYCCGGYGAEPLSIKTNRNIKNAIVRDGKLYMLSDTGEVLSMERGDVEVKSHGNLDIRPGSLFEVSGGKALIAVQNRVYIADLAKPGVVAVQTFPEPITGIGALDATKFFVLQKGQIRTIETATGKPLEMISLGKEKGKEPHALGAHARGNRIYVFAHSEEKQAILAIDWKKNQIENEYPMAATSLRPGSLTVEATDDTVFIGGIWYSYGIPMASVGTLDLASKKYVRANVPTDFRGIRLVPGNPQRLSFVGEQAVYQMDATATVTAKALPKANGSMLAVWGRNAVFASNGALDIMPLNQPATVKSANSN
ncbi:MAG: hypothetical protein K2X38_20500 [Gemmataceae bacterium]|nr:hypothetical protein [Gemmataceae bacterium]